MDLKRKTFAVILVVLGGTLLAAGVALVYVPAGLIVAGLLVAAAGLLGVDVK